METGLVILSFAVINLLWFCHHLYQKITFLEKRHNQLHMHVLEYVGALTARMNVIPKIIELREEDALDIN